MVYSFTTIKIAIKINTLEGTEWKGGFEQLKNGASNPIIKSKVAVILSTKK